MRDEAFRYQVGGYLIGGTVSNQIVKKPDTRGPVGLRQVMVRLR